MRTINHFVIRNGKVVSKIDAEKLPELQPPKLNIVKPATVIVRHLDDKVHAESDELSKIRKYYENIIQGYQDKVRQLERELFQKNQLISKLNKQKIMQSEAISTARDSRQSRLTFKQETQRVSFDSLCLNQPQLKTINFHNIEPTSQSKQNNAQYQITDLISKKYSEDKNNESGNEENFKIKELPAISSMSSIHSVSSVSQCISSENKNQHQQPKTFFDTSTLLARLNKSASLVRNIKKFLQPTAASPKSITQQPSSPSSDPPQSQQSLVPSDQNPAMEQQFNQSYYQIELQKFIDELVQKHEQILLLLQQITIEKDQQLKQTKSYYELIISRMQFQRICRNGCDKNSPYSKYYSESDRMMLKMVGQGCLDGKQNNKSRQKLREKSLQKLRISAGMQKNQRIPLQICQSRYDENQSHEFQSKQQ